MWRLAVAFSLMWLAVQAASAGWAVVSLRFRPEW
jgi:hypothetical protein